MPVLLNTNIKAIGSCPHGLPPGACPICSGGGASSSINKVKDTTKDAELNILKNFEAQFAQNLLTHQQRRKKEVFYSYVSWFYTLPIKIKEFIPKAVQNVINAFLAAPIIALNFTFNFINFIPQFIGQTFKNEKLKDISDKLAAIFGEAKNKLEKELEKAKKRILKTVESLMGLLGIEVDLEKGKADDK